VVAKIQYYVFRARQLFLGYQVGAKDKSNDFHKKKIILAMQDVLFFNGVYSKDDVINRFKKHHPETLTNNDYLMLTGRDNDITKYLPIYENIYSLVLTLAKERPLVPQKPFWWKYNDMFVEYLLPKGKIRGAIVLCDGLPSIPYQRELMNELLFTDYAVFFPRYRGTWESGGEFLKESPIKDIKSLSLALINGIEINKIDFKTEQIVLIGTSFGGAVALSLANESEVKKVIALSPVIDFVGVPSVRSLGNFLQSTFTGAYRFENKNWHFLATGQLMNPINDVEKKNGKKIHIFAGKQDEDVSPKSLLDFCLSVGAFYHLKEKCAHISFSKIDGILLDDIKNMI
jgi:esterase/lipase